MLKLLIIMGYSNNNKKNTIILIKKMEYLTITYDPLIAFPFIFLFHNYFFFYDKI